MFITLGKTGSRAFKAAVGVAIIKLSDKPIFSS